MIKVFYDGACGLCAKEILHYQKIAPTGRFDWVDVMQTPEKLENTGLTQVDALMALYAQDAQGQLHKGVDAFLIIWANLRRWRLLVPLVKLPGVYQLAGWVYKHFAKWRFKRLAHCQMANQKAKADSL